MWTPADKAMPASAQPRNVQPLRPVMTWSGITRSKPWSRSGPPGSRAKGPVRRSQEKEEGPAAEPHRAVAPDGADLLPVREQRVEVERLVGEQHEAAALAAGRDQLLLGVRARIRVRGRRTPRPAVAQRLQALGERRSWAKTETAPAGGPSRRAWTYRSTLLLASRPLAAVSSRSSR